jgi:hypothetical protein
MNIPALPFREGQIWLCQSLDYRFWCTNLTGEPSVCSGRYRGWKPDADHFLELQLFRFENRSGIWRRCDGNSAGNLVTLLYDPTNPT